jgi:hypothetical protein
VAGVVVSADHEGPERVHERVVAIAAIAGTEEIADQPLEALVAEPLIEVAEEPLFLFGPHVVDLVVRSRLLEQRVVLLLRRWRGVVEVALALTAEELSALGPPQWREVRARSGAGDVPERESSAVRERKERREDDREYREPPGRLEELVTDRALTSRKSHGDCSLLPRQGDCGSAPPARLGGAGLDAGRRPALPGRFRPLESRTGKTEATAESSSDAFLELAAHEGDNSIARAISVAEDCGLESIGAGRFAAAGVLLTAVCKDDGSRFGDWPMRRRHGIPDRWSQRLPLTVTSLRE